jgi:uncharacterized protein (DUF1800 family)
MRANKMKTSLTQKLDENDWNPSTARHLLNRAGFGGPRSLIEKMESMGFKRAVLYLTHPERVTDNIQEPDWLVESESFREMRSQFKDLDRDQRKKRRRMMRHEQRQAVERLKSWWLKQSLVTTRPLQEKMAHFWHGHFATSARKVRSSQMNYKLNQVFRKEGLGKLKTLVTHVSQSPAMLQYLDNRQNKKGHPNENFARELMELFTLGIGNYSEQDVQEAARAFTGWTIRDGSFRENDRQHDNGIKTFMGRTGNFDGYDIIDILSEQEAMIRFISLKLWEYFVYEKPDEETVDQLVFHFKRSRFKIAGLLQTIFSSSEFYSVRARRRSIKSPAQLMINLVDQLEIDTENTRDKLMAVAMRGMGQDLFYPPNVKGWPGNRDWINSNTLLTRYNLPSYFLYGNTGRNKKSGRKNSGNRRNKGPFRNEHFFEPYAGRPAGEVVDTLIDRFIGEPLDSDQRQALLEAIHPNATESLRLPEGRKSAKRLTGVVHLILSTAEYQLC